MIQVKESPLHGRGVFAISDMRKGAVLECPVVLVEKMYTIPGLNTYLYPWDRSHNSICMGFGSFFNSSQSPNVVIDSIDKDKMVKRFRLLTNVKQGTELLLKYNIE